MARYSNHVNDRVGREQAEILQQKLFEAATQALDSAMEEQKIPGTLLSACQSILRDSGLAPDLSSPSDTDGPDGADAGPSASWLEQLAKDAGL